MENMMNIDKFSGITTGPDNTIDTEEQSLHISQMNITNQPINVLTGITDKTDEQKGVEDCDKKVPINGTNYDGNNKTNKQTRAIIKLKVLTVELHRLTNVDLEQAKCWVAITKQTQTSGFTKEIKKSSRQAKVEYKPTKLYKDLSGKKPRFTFSMRWLSKRHRRNYKFHCVIASCNRLFNTVKEWKSHHLFKHGSVKYKCT